MKNTLIAILLIIISIIKTLIKLLLNTALFLYYNILQLIYDILKKQDIYIVEIMFNTESRIAKFLKFDYDNLKTYINENKVIKDIDKKIINCSNISMTIVKDKINTRKVINKKYIE